MVHGSTAALYSPSELCCNQVLFPPSQLYEQILAENEKLKAQLRDTDHELADLKLQLEKATQVRPALAPQPPQAPLPAPLPYCKHSAIVV